MRNKLHPAKQPRQLLLFFYNNNQRSQNICILIFEGIYSTLYVLNDIHTYEMMYAFLYLVK